MCEAGARGGHRPRREPRHRLEAVALTLAYALGAATPLLAIAIGGRRVSAPLRARMPWLRPTLGGVVALTALAIALDFDQRFQLYVPGYTEAFQERVERSGPPTASSASASPAYARRAVSERRLDDYGPAPDFAGIERWLNA